MPIPTENVGSLPRPTRLQDAIAAYDARTGSHEQLVAEQDAACKDSIERTEATGSPIVSDGEQRASSFAPYPLTSYRAVDASLLYPLDGQLEDYSREQFLSDLCDQAEQDIRQAFAAGALRVSIDFTGGRLAIKNDPRNPWTGRAMLQQFIEVNHRVIDRFSPAERVNIGTHLPG